MRRHIDPWPYMTKSSIYVILNHHGQECSGESSPCNRTRLIERMMNYAGFDFPYFLFPKHLIKMVMNFAGFKSEDILDNINDKNFSNFTMVSWMELVVVQLYYLQLRKAPRGIQEKLWVNLKMKRWISFETCRWLWTRRRPLTLGTLIWDRSRS